MTEPSELEPAQHDDPENGPIQGWSAADFGPEDYASVEEVDGSTELVADGGVPSDDPEED